MLEDRRLLATFTVTSTGDTNDSNGNPTSGTLRWAAEQADQATSPSTIDFNLGASATITLAQLLKPVELSNTSQPVTISGPGASQLTINGGQQGAVLRVDPGVTATITGLTVTGASLDLNGNGGAISNLGTLTISDCTLSGNSISGLYDKGTMTASDLTISGNDSFYGAGIFVKATATITGCTITGNKGARGAGVCNQGTSKLENCTITGDSALGGGGGLYNSGKVSVYNSTIGGGDGGGGGDVYNKQGGNAYLASCTISGGSGFINGGDLNNAYGGTLKLESCVVSGGTADSGAGLYNTGQATLDKCTITGNSSSGTGGGVANGPLQNKAVLTITNSTLAGNTSKGDGAGVFNNGTANLTDDTIADNFGNQGTSLLAANGGGVDNSGTATLVACTISGNTTTAKGGGVYNGGLGANAMTLTDTIVAGNTSTASPSHASDIEVGSSPTGPYNVSGTYDLVGTGGAGGLATGGHNLLGVASPGLGTLGNNGGPTPTMALLPGSPAIGAGTAVVGVSTDQRGDPLDTPNPDLGAYQTQPQVILAFSDLASPKIVYGTASVTLGGTLAHGSQAPQGEKVAVTLNGVTQQATVGSGGAFSTTFNTATLSASGSPYTVTYAYAGDATFAPLSGSGALTVTRATPTVGVTDAGGAYTGSAYTATATVAGIGGTAGPSLEGISPALSYYSGTYTTAAQLAGLTALPGAPSQAGAYTVLASFPGSADYAPASALANFAITTLVPTVKVTDAGGVFSGLPFAATATVAAPGGTAGPSLEGVAPALSYYSGTYTSASQLAGLTALPGAPSRAGSYTVLATFPGSTDYVGGGTALANFAIDKAAPMLAVSNAGGAFKGSPFATLATVAGVAPTPGASLEGVPLAVAYYSGTYTSAGQLDGLTPLSGDPSQAGAYTILASFPGSADYGSRSAVANFTISRAAPTLTVTDAGGAYSGSAFPAVATVAGVGGTAGPGLEGVAPTLAYYSGTYTSPSQLAGLTPLSGAPTQVGRYTAAASFAGSADYAPASQVADFTIAGSTPQVTWSAPASIVYGTPLGASQLDATASVPGTFSYSPAAETVLDAGNGQVLTSVFTPDDTLDYATVTTTTKIDVAPATPMLSVTAPGGTFDGSPFPASITVGAGNNAPAASLQDVAPALTYYVGSGTSGPSLGSSPPSHPGTYTVVASFPGTADYAPARSTPLTFTIARATPTVAVAASGGSSAFGQPVTMTATVTPTAPATGGTVTFYDGPTPLGTATLDATGRATLTTSALGVGAHAITAAYAGDADLLGATSPAASASVAPAGTRVVFTPQPVFKRKRMTALNLAARVQPTPPGAGAPTGTVTFEVAVKKRKKVAEKVLGTASLSGGAATLAIRPRLVLKKPITVAYGGDADFQSSGVIPPVLTPRSLKGLARPAGR